MNALPIVLDSLGALAVFGIVIVVAMVRTGASTTRDLDARLRQFAAAEGGAGVAAPGGEGGPASLGARLRQLFERTSLRADSSRSAASSERLARTTDSLARADLKLRATEWYLIRSGLVVVGGLLALAVYRNLIFAAIAAVVLFFVPPFYLRMRERRRLQRFNDQLDDTLTLMSNALKAGYSFPQALSSIARSAQPPVSEEFARATREVQLGVSTDDALHHMVERVRSEDLDLVVTAVQIQRVVGGNLAEILDTIAFTIRERVRIKGEIRTLTAQARASSYIITALPIGLILILQAINPSYIKPLLNFAGPGPYILIGCAVSIAAAFYVMRRITNIEV